MRTTLLRSHQKHCALCLPIGKALIRSAYRKSWIQNCQSLVHTGIAVCYFWFAKANDLVSMGISGFDKPTPSAGRLLYLLVSLCSKAARLIAAVCSYWRDTAELLQVPSSGLGNGFDPFATSNPHSKSLLALLIQLLQLGARSGSSMPPPQPTPNFDPFGSLACASVLLPTAWCRRFLGLQAGSGGGCGQGKLFKGLLTKLFCLAEIQAPWTTSLA